MTTRTNRGWDYKRALAELWERSSYERGLISDPFGDSARAERGLARMRRLLAALGDPHMNLPAVHIAGSKGKGRPAPLSPRPRSRRVTVLGSTRPRICTASRNASRSTASLFLTTLSPPRRGRRLPLRGAWSRPSQTSGR